VVLSGVVLDADTKKAVIGAKITTNAFPYPALTAKEGSFKYPMKLKAGTYTLEVAAPGYKTLSLSLEVVTGMKELPMTIWLALDSSPYRSLAEHPDGKPFEPVGVRGAEKALAARSANVDPSGEGDTPKPGIHLITGLLKDAKSGEPVSGTIMLKEQKLQVPVDAAGRFVLSLQPGVYTVELAIVGFVPEEKNIEVTGNSDVIWELIPVERDRHFYGYHEKISDKTVAGISDLPGVTIAAPRRRYDTGFGIAGSPSPENGYYIEGLPSPFAFHLLGRDTVIHPALVGTAELSYGGFSPEYGDATGGMVSLTLRDPREDRLGGMFDLSLFGVSVLAEGPVTEHDLFAAAVSKGLTDLFPRFFYGEGSDLLYNDNFDFTMLYLRKFSGGHRLRVYAFGSMDSLGFRSGDLMNGVPEHVDLIAPSQFFTRLVADHAYSWKELDVEIDNRVLLSYENRHWQYGFAAGDDFGLSSHVIEGQDVFHWRFDPQHKLSLGGAMRLGFFSPATDYVSLPLEGEPFAVRVARKIDDPGYQPYLHPSLWASYLFSYAGFTVEPGLLFYADFHNKKHYELSADPRLTTAYRFDDTMELRLSGGLYSRRPDYEIASDRWGTEDLLAEHAVHAVLSFEKTFLGLYTVTAKGFYKYLYNLIRRSNADPLEFNNLGEGYAAGGVLALKIDIADTFRGTVGYAYTASQRKESPAGEYRPSDAEVPHSVTLSGRWTPAKEWALSGRFSLFSGAPYSRFSGAEFIDDGIVARFEPLPILDGNGRVIRNDARYPVLHELDLRGEYTFFLDHTILVLFAEMRGISGLFDQNAVGSLYNTDFTKNTPLSSTPFSATVGIRGEF